MITRKQLESKFMESFKDWLYTTIEGVNKLLNEYGIRHTFIGASALNLHDYNRTTEDIDILVNREDKEKMKNLPIGFIREISKGRGKVFIWSDPKAKVEVIYSGEISGDGIHGIEFRRPEDISIEIDGIPVLSLKDLILYKISSGIYGRRNKDFGDVQNLIQIYNLGENFGDDFREDLMEEYKRIWKDAQEEVKFF
jgi:hypothetical protein